MRRRIGHIFCIGCIASACVPAAAQQNAESLPDAVKGKPYAVRLAGRIAPEGPVKKSVVYAAAKDLGALPEKLSLDRAKGEISGVPSEAGVSRFTIVACDSAGSPQNCADKTFSLRVLEAFKGLPNATLGRTYKASLAPLQLKTGEAVSYSILKNAGALLPDGLTLDEKTGEISGTPTRIEAAELAVQVCGKGAPDDCVWTKVSLRVIGDFASRPLELNRLYEGMKKIIGRGWEDATIRVFVDDDRAALKAKAASETTPVYSAQSGAEGEINVELIESAVAGQTLRVVQERYGQSSDKSITVEDRYNWGRVRGSFAYGGIFSKGLAEFSQIDPYLSYTHDTFWHYRSGGSYFRTDQDEVCGCEESANDPKKKARMCAEERDRRPKRRCFPGWYGPRRRLLFQTFFEARLTSIPVVTAVEGTAFAVPAQEVFLPSRKSAEAAAGGTIPVLLTQWRFARGDYALYLGPLGKVGFLTPTDEDVTDLPGISPGLTEAERQRLRENRKRVYHYWHAGARSGLFKMSAGRSTAPREVCRIDFAAGQYGNLATVYGKRVEQWNASPGSPAVTSFFTKTDWRYLLDGFLSIPKTRLFVGFSANLGRNPPSWQEFDRRIGAHPFSPRPEDKITLLYQGPLVLPPRDDVRFIFGARVDLGQSLRGLLPFGQ